MTSTLLGKKIFVALCAIGAIFTATLSPTSSASADDAFSPLSISDGIAGVLDAGCSATGFSVTVDGIEYTNGDVISDFPVDGLVPGGGDPLAEAGRFTFTGDPDITMVNAVALDADEETRLFPFVRDGEPAFWDFSTPVADLSGGRWSEIYSAWDGALNNISGVFYPAVIAHPCDDADLGLAYVQVFPGITIDASPVLGNGEDSWWELAVNLDSGEIDGVDPAYRAFNSGVVAAAKSDFPNAGYAFWANYFWIAAEYDAYWSDDVDEWLPYEPYGNAAVFGFSPSPSIEAIRTETGSIELALWSYAYAEAGDLIPFEFLQSFASVDGEGQISDSLVSETDDPVDGQTLNPFSTTAESWIEPQDPLDKIQLVTFGNYADDSVIFFIPEGVTCSYGGISAQGPFLYASEVDKLDDGECTVDESDSDYIPRDDATRRGAIPLGFDVNFFGGTFSNFYIGTNGVVSFEEPVDDYDLKLSILGLGNETSLIAPFAVDLVFVAAESNIWIAPTTIDGSEAMIVSWENMVPYGYWDEGDQDPGKASFQLVLIDDDAGAGGDFHAYFNYAEITDINEGYDVAAWVNAETGVTIGSNELTAVYSEGFFARASSECQVIDSAYPWFGNFTSGVLNSWDGEADFLEGAYFKTENAANQTLSIWEDSSCSIPINIDAIQNVEDNGRAYLSLVPSSLASLGSAAVGWVSYDDEAYAVNSAEIFEYEDIQDLYDGSGSALELISYSYNTEVPGRIVLWQVAGVTQGFTPRQYDFEESANRAIASRPYVGPVVQSLTPNFAGTDEARVTGLRLSTVDKVSVRGAVLTSRFDAMGNLFFDTSSLSAGTYIVEFSSSIAGVTFYTQLVVAAKAVTQTTGQKVNAGSFKGYVAVYAKGYEGQRLSAKVGKDWVIVASIPSSTNNLYRHVEFTGAGVDVAVRIYINRVLIDTINLTTK